MSQQNLADAIDMDRRVVAKIETRDRGISLAEAIAIANALSVGLCDAVSEDPLTLQVSVPID